MARLAALLGLFALAACRDSVEAALLAGSWACHAATGDYRLSREVTYGEDGSLAARVTIESTDGGIPVTMHFAVGGRWALEGARLSEELATHRLMRFARDGANVPLVELPAGFVTMLEGRLAGQSALHEISELTPERLVLHDTAQGGETACTRQPPQ